MTRHALLAARAAARPRDDPRLGARARRAGRGHRRVVLRQPLRHRGLAARGRPRRSARTPATLALYGRIYADSVGGLVAWRLGGIALALAGLMSILIVVRHTRAEEETGRAELRRRGRRRPPRAARRGAARRRRPRASRSALLVALGARRHRARADAASLALGAAFAGGRARVRRRRRGRRAGRRVRARGATGSRVAVARRRVRAARDRRRRPALARRGSRRSAGRSSCAPFARRALVAAARAPRARRGARPSPPRRLAARRDLGAGLLPPRPGPARGALRDPARARLAPAARRARRLGGRLRDRSAPRSAASPRTSAT